MNKNKQKTVERKRLRIRRLYKQILQVQLKDLYELRQSSILAVKVNPYY